MAEGPLHVEIRATTKPCRKRVNGALPIAGQMLVIALMALAIFSPILYGIYVAVNFIGKCW